MAVIILKECQRLDVLARSLEFVVPRSPEYREIELSNLLGEIVRLVSPVTEAPSIQIRRAPDLRLVCDPELIQQAVLNIITNASRIIGQADEIVLSAHVDKGEAEVEISHQRAGVLGCIRIPLAAAPEGQPIAFSHAEDAQIRRMEIE